jgi:hypothetical protein
MMTTKASQKVLLLLLLLRGPLAAGSSESKFCFSNQPCKKRIKTLT